MKNFLIRVLDFFNLLDHKKNLSISNIAVIILLVKIAMSPTIDWAVVSALLLSLLNYSHKRTVNSKVKEEAPTVDLSPLVEALEETKQEVRKVADMATEAKEKAGNVALAMGIRTKKIGGT